MRNLNPTSESQLKSRMLVLMLALSMLAGGAQCVAQALAPVVGKVQTAERQSREAIRFTQRLYHFYKLSTEQATAVRGAN